MVMSVWSVFWCTTADGGRDGWVVAHTPVVAITYFAVEHGYDLREVGAERILDVRAAQGPRVWTPTKHQLATWGIQYNKHFHVFHLGQRIFRPDGIVRSLLCSAARNRLRMKLRAQRETG